MRRHSRGAPFAALLALVGILLSTCYPIALLHVPAYAAESEPGSKNPSVQLTAEERAWLEAHAVITVVQDPGWPPIEFADDQGAPSGITDDYLRLVEQRLGVTFKRVTRLNWQDAYDRLKRWDIDMTTSVAVTPERRDFWAFTKPYMSIPIVIFAQNDVTYIPDMQDLSGKTVAVVDGYAVSDWIPRDFPRIRLVKVKSAKEGIDAVQQGRVFAFIDNMLVVSYYLAKLKTANVKIVGETPYINAQCMAVRKDWSILAEILQKALESISEKERAEIYQKWVPVRYEHGFNYALAWQVAGLLAAIILGLLIWNRRLSREITRRRAAEAALEDEAIRRRILVERSRDGIVILNQNGSVYEANRRFAEMLGYSFEEVSRLSVWDWEYVLPKDRVLEMLGSVDEKGDSFETRHRRKDGTTYHVDIRTNAAVFAGQKLIFCVCRDITERKKAEEVHERLMAAIEQTDDTVVITDSRGAIQYVNPAFERSTGYSREEVLGRNPGIFGGGPQDKELYQTLWGTISAGNTWKGRVVNRRKDGALITLAASVSPVRDSSGRIVNFVAVARDMTEQLRLQSQFEQAQRMESVGRLAGGVAHDFNNMLGVILGYTEIAMTKTDSSSPIYGDLQEVLRAARRSAEITRQLLAFARKQTIAPKTVSLNETVEGMLKMMRRLIGEDIDLVWLPARDLWSVKMDPSQLDQIFANLCVNARDAIVNVGKITIETSNVAFDRAYCEDHPGFFPGEFVQLAFSDDGTGMDQETLGRIFEPFFTTKGAGQGTGLGLATVFGIVKQNEGFINVYSEPGKGTTFKIYLPRSSDNVPRAEEQVGGPVSGHGETVLLVEDEAAMLFLAERFLNGLGYRVLTAKTPEAAIKIAADYEGEIHLLITDVVLPGMNGKDLSAEILRMRPLAKCLYMSGYTADTIAHRGVLDEGVQFIQKPFTLRQFADKVADALK